ncbi:MAG: hypothetical protein GY851_34745 [bacterium]|nr:hypothetical protein [bacterium]
MMDPGVIQRHCAELERCNQRGGHMLSVLDLLDKRTLDMDVAAYLMARISRGSSFMVGANPGGAGKTTVMCALLNLVPAEVELAAATDAAVATASRTKAKRRRCYVCHEIGAGPYFAYLWGAELRTYCELTERGHLLATNLHADDLDEARNQVCVDNRVPEAHFNRFDLMLFLRVERGDYDTIRRVAKVYASDSGKPHRLIFSDDGTPLDASGADPAWLEACRGWLEYMRTREFRSIEQTRERVWEFFAANGCG